MVLVDMLPHAGEMARVTKPTDLFRFVMQETYVENLPLFPRRAGAEARVFDIQTFKYILQWHQWQLI
jgi:hypothetical protein